MLFKTHLKDDQQERTTKGIWLAAAVSFFFLILMIRLAYVQIVQAQANIRLSKENRMQFHRLKAPRGRIFDRNGVVLARNRPSYSICVLPYKLHHPKETIANLLKIKTSDTTSLFDTTTLTKAIKKARYRRFDLTRLKEDVSLNVVSIIEERAMELPGIVIETESRREYPFGPDIFHLVGYMTEIPEEQFDSLKEVGYSYGDLIGKAGIEKQYEHLFHGTDGREYVEVNAYGKRLGRIPNMPRAEPVPGSDLYLAIDIRLQQKAHEVFPDTLKGAVVIYNPQNGEVLCMYSSPTVDPNIFSLSSTLRSKNWVSIAMDSNLPLNNRCITGTYPPGSTFKLVTATAALATGNYHGWTKMPRPCHGVYYIGRLPKKCWYGPGHGSMDLVGAVRQSCNVYFYQLGLQLGDEHINTYAHLLGLGERTGVDLPNEKNGYLSGEKAHNIRFKYKIEHGEGWQWTPGLLADMAIGQAQTLTPLHLARMAGTLAQGSTLFKPYLLKEVRTFDGTIIEQKHPVTVHPLNLDSTTIKTVRRAMLAVLGPGGTARRARVPGVNVGGKTGSAENPHGEKTHSLFVGTAPVDNPSFAIAVVAENAGHGSAVAAPIAGELLRYYFSAIDSSHTP